jgi:TPR repeat protein
MVTARRLLRRSQFLQGAIKENAVDDGREVLVMSAPMPNENETPAMGAAMYAPPWARGAAAPAAAAAAAAADAGLAAVDKALNASDEFRRTLPRAASLEDGKRWRDKPFEGDVAAKRLRERGSLDPVAVPMPPVEARGASGALLARVAGAVGLAALAAFVVVGAMPQSRLFATAAQEPPQVKAEAMVPQPVTTVQEPPAPAPAFRPLAPDEVALLLKRSDDLMAQGDIASARLMLARAAEAGEARAALALGASYDANVLRKLGVIGVAGDAAKARTWYEKAAEYGSGEATRRLEQFAQSR